MTKKHIEGVCSGCGAKVAVAAQGGACAACLLRMAIEADTSIGTDHPDVPDWTPAARKPPSIPPGCVVRFGDYELVTRRGRGGQGVVYEARHVGPIPTQRVVALKMILGGESASRTAVRLFHTEVAAAAKLEHPSIVRIYEVREHDGRPYFTMKLMRGGSLADKIKAERAAKNGKTSADKPAKGSFFGHPKTIDLVETIARAVHYAHQHGILHCDLKPANILLDENGRPHVADFGLAKHVDQDGFTLAGAAEGTPSYMAPEQANGQTLTSATDIYGLGVILYELLTGEVPFKGKKAAEVLEQVKNSPVPDPRTIQPLIHRDLARICLKCLEKSPQKRYRSAEDLASDLCRYRNDEVLASAGRAERALRWSLRHPVTAVLILTAALFLLVMTSRAVSLTREQEALKRAQIREVNMNSAAMVAGTVLLQIRALSDAVERAASNDKLVLAFESGDMAALQSWCESTYTFYDDPAHGLRLNGNSPFYLWFVIDKDGVAKAIYPTPNRIGQNYAWRDYFKGVKRLAEKGLRSTYVSPAYKSESNGYYSFTIAAPIYSSGRKQLGVLAAGVPAAATLGSLVVRDTQSSMVLAAPRGRERDEPTPPSTHLILLHPEYVHGEAIPIDNEQVRKLDEASRDPAKRIEHPLGLPPPDLVTSSDAYEDPMGKGNHDEKRGSVKPPNVKYQGRFLAGFAPVGNTGFVVIVQTPDDVVLDSERTFAKQFAKWTGVAAGSSVLLMLLGVWYGRRRREQRAQ